MKRPTICCALLVTFLSARAEEQVRSTQEELRRRNIYFGDIDGKRSDEFQEALKRYQKRKGIDASGKEDPDTLRSLGLLARAAGEPAPKELSWPEEPVLKSDARIKPEEKGTPAADAALPAAESAPDAEVDEGLFVFPSPVGAGPEAEPVAKAGKQRRGATKVASTEESRSGRGRVQLSPKAAQHNGTAVLKFVQGFLKSIGRGSVGDELPFYADKVDYFGNGPVDRRTIERALRAYYQRWPSRKYTAAKDVSYQLVPSRSEVVVTYRVAFSLKNQNKKVSGRTENRLVINAATADPRIVSIQERRIRG